MGLNLGGRRRGARGKSDKAAEPEGGEREDSGEAGNQREESSAPRARGRGSKAAGGEKPKATPGATLSFMRRGKAARDELDRAKKRQEAKRRGTFRYWMKPGEEKIITFLDGGLDKDGMLDCPSFYEHTVPHGGKFADVVCAARNEDEEGNTGRCAVCDGGGDNCDPAFVGAFTVVEWLDEPWVDGKGNEHRYRRRLFVAKIKTLELLQAKATKLAERNGTDGLVGVTFEVTRTSDRDARVGNNFDLLAVTPAEKFDRGLVCLGEDDWEELEEETGQPLDYSQEFRMFSAEEMEDLGFGAVPEKQFGRSRRGKAAGKRRGRGSIEDEM